MRWLLIICFLIFRIWNVFAQTPTSCFEIESILVDACVPGTGCTNASSPACSCEGKNEMVRFKVGTNPLFTSNMTVNWPNNNWLGLCQNATTAAHTAALNSTIQSCGWLLEPTNGILPAGAEVILITSTDFCTVGNSFANLADTVYILFQCAGNYAGHFANYGTGLRTLIISFGPGCADTVTYDRSQLVNQNGIPSASNADGSTVLFDWPGNPTYVNYGCQAPVNTVSVNASINSSPPFCKNDTIMLTGTYSGTVYGVNWSGGNGYFTQPNNDTTLYIISPNDISPTAIYFSVYSCNDTITDTLWLNVTPSLNANVTASPNDTICQGDTITLTASGGTFYYWNTGQQTPSIKVYWESTFAVTIGNGCEQTTITVPVKVLSQPAPMIHTGGQPVICPNGEPLYLIAVGGSSFYWSTGDTSQMIAVNQGGTYYLVAKNQCGEDTAYITIPQSNVYADFTPLPPSGPLPLDVIFYNNSTNSTQYFWNFGDGKISNQLQPSHTFTSPGEYNVMLIAYDDFGCSDTAYHKVYVSDETFLLIPNVMTPNNDGNNDFFTIKSLGAVNLQCKIFNRWGEEIAGWTGIDGKWDGIIDKKDATEGTYFYIVEIEWYNGKKESKTGFFTLLR